MGYYETSALTGAGVSEAMDTCVRVGLTRAGTSHSVERRRRFILPWKRWVKFRSIDIHCLLWSPYKQATLYNTARLMGPKVSPIACVLGPVFATHSHREPQIFYLPKITRYTVYILILFERKHNMARGISTAQLATLVIKVNVTK